MTSGIPLPLVPESVPARSTHDVPTPPRRSGPLEASVATTASTLPSEPATAQGHMDTAMATALDRTLHDPHEVDDDGTRETARQRFGTDDEIDFELPSERRRRWLKQLLTGVFRRRSRVDWNKVAGL